MSSLLKKAEFARFYGLSKQRVGKLCKDNKLTLKGKLIDTKGYKTKEYLKNTDRLAETKQVGKIVKKQVKKIKKKTTKNESNDDFDNRYNSLMVKFQNGSISKNEMIELKNYAEVKKNIHGAELEQIKVKKEEGKLIQRDLFFNDLETSLIKLKQSFTLNFRNTIIVLLGKYDINKDDKKNIENDVLKAIEDNLLSYAKDLKELEKKEV